MRIKSGILTPVIYFLILIFFPSCGSDPVSPESSIHIADYFPLIEGSSRKYSCSYVRSFRDDYGNPVDVTADGNCELKVNKVQKDNPYTKASLEIVFKITDSNFSNFRDTTYSREFDILQTPDSIWYVSDAPSLEQLDKGNRAPMMFFREDSSLFADLRMFALDFREIFYYAKEVYELELPLKTNGESLEFNRDTIDYGPSIQSNAARSTVNLREGKGIHYIESLFVYHRTLSHSDFVKVRLNLIE